MGSLYPKVKTLTEPTTLPVGLDDAKEQMVVEHSDDDLLIYRLISVATTHVQVATGLSLVMQKKRLLLDGFGTEIYLPKGPVQSIDQIQYVDPDGNTQTVSSSVYQFDTVEPYVRPAYNQSWPSPRNQVNSVWVDYWVGYYDPASSPIDLTEKIPDDLEHAILFLVAELYKNRESQIDLQNYKNPVFDHLIGPHRQYIS